MTVQNYGISFDELSDHDVLEKAGWSYESGGEAVGY